MTTKVCARKDDHVLWSQCCGSRASDEVDTRSSAPGGRCYSCKENAIFEYTCLRCEGFCLTCNEGPPPDPEIVCGCE